MTDTHDWASELDVPRHPLADQFTAPKDDTPGQCACGAELPPMREWDGYPHPWPRFTCKGCGRGFVDEDDYIAVYDEGLDLDDDDGAGGSNGTTWDDVAQAFRQRGGGEQSITEAVDALRTTKLRPSFVLDEIETRFPDARAGNE